MKGEARRHHVVGKGVEDHVPLADPRRPVSRGPESPCVEVGLVDRAGRREDPLEGAVLPGQAAEGRPLPLQGDKPFPGQDGQQGKIFPILDISGFQAEFPEHLPNPGGLAVPQAGHPGKPFRQFFTAVFFRPELAGLFFFYHPFGLVVSRSFLLSGLFLGNQGPGVDRPGRAVCRWAPFGGV